MSENLFRFFFSLLCTYSADYNITISRCFFSLNLLIRLRRRPKRLKRGNSQKAKKFSNFNLTCFAVAGNDFDLVHAMRVSAVSKLDAVHDERPHVVAEAIRIQLALWNARLASSLSSRLLALNVTLFFVFFASVSFIVLSN